MIILIRHLNKALTWGKTSRFLSHSQPLTKKNNVKVKFIFIGSTFCVLSRQSDKYIGVLNVCIVLHSLGFPMHRSIRSCKPVDLQAPVFHSWLWSPTPKTETQVQYSVSSKLWKIHYFMTSVWSIYPHHNFFLLLTIMEHLSQNKNVIICQTVHGLEQSRMWASSFAHTCDWRSSGHQ